MPQIAIPIASRAHVKRAWKVVGRKHNLMTSDTLVKKTVWLKLSDIKSEQMCLRIDKLLYQLRHHAEMQRKKRPGVVMARGLLLLWDGNHRVTSGILLGKKRMRCDLFYDPAECARTVKYIERGGRK